MLMHAFLYKQHFYKQHQDKTDKKNQANAKQRPEVSLLLLGNYSHSSSEKIERILENR